MLFPRFLNEARVEELGHRRYRRLHVLEADQPVGHLLVSRLADQSIRAECLQFGHEVIIGVRRVLAILAGIFHQDVDGLFLVVRIVEPSHRAAVCLDVGKKRRSDSWRPNRY